MAAPSSVYAENGGSAPNTVAVTAIVEPHIYIIVDTKGDISRVYSNSKSEVEPIVLLGSLAGTPGRYTTEVAAQYSRLRPKLDYASGPGVLYKQPAKQLATSRPLIQKASMISLVLRPLTGLTF